MITLQLRAFVPKPLKCNFRKHDVALAHVTSRLEPCRVSSEADTHLARTQTGELQVRTKAEATRHRNASLGKVKMTRVQKLAQEWVESIFTELLIMVLLVMDLSLTIYEFKSDRPDELAHTKNPLMVMTGGILFVFFF